MYELTSIKDMNLTIFIVRISLEFFLNNLTPDKNKYLKIEMNWLSKIDLTVMKNG